MKKFKSYIAEKLDRTQFHTSVERGVFGKHSSDGNKDDYLLDLDNKAGGKKDGPPMLVTFAKEADAKKAQKKFGGKIVKTTFGTYRIKK